MIRDFVSHAHVLCPCWRTCDRPTQSKDTSARTLVHDCSHVLRVGREQCNQKNSGRASRHTMASRWHQPQQPGGGQSQPLQNARQSACQVCQETRFLRWLVHHATVPITAYILPRVSVTEVCTKRDHALGESNTAIVFKRAFSDQQRMLCTHTRSHPYTHMYVHVYTPCTRWNTALLPICQRPEFLNLSSL